MSFVSRVYEHRRSVASVTVVAIFGAAFVGFALRAEGEATAQVDVNDSGVWVTRTSSGELGRFNNEAQALDGSLLAGTAEFDVQQDASRVLLADHGASSASPVDPAHLTLSGPLRAPKGALIVSGGSTTAVMDPEDGRLWVLPFEGMLAFDEEELKPTAELGKGGRLTVSDAGTVFVAVPADGSVYTVRTSARGAVVDTSTTALAVAEDAEVEITAVGDEPVVLNRTASELVLPGGVAVEVAEGAEARLQQPSGEADAVVVATPGSLVSQPLGGGDATVRRADGNPAAPVQLGECTFGAWAGTGQVIRDCPGTDRDVDEVLEGAPSELAYRVNRDVIVLNDVATGVLWMAAEEFEKVDDWDLTMPEDAEGEKIESETATPEFVDQFVLERDKPNRPPQPKDDDLGARPGRTTVLNVLGNDTDPDGDVMTVSVAKADVDGKSGATVHRVLDGAALQVDVPATASGSFTATYTVDDGRGGTADASVRVSVVPPEQNELPVAAGEPVMRVAQGGTASIKLLPYWRDPDGDDLVLATATTVGTDDEVRFRPDGTVEFRDGGAATGRKIVDVTVADSGGLVGQGRLLVDVVAEQRPPVAVGDHVAVVAGRAVTVSPLKNDTDPNGDRLRLVHVAEQAPATITPNFAAGTFRFLSQEPGSYDLTYQVSDGPDATLGLVRVDVLPPPDSVGTPIAVTDTVLLPAGGSTLVDVLANDTDPAGGVLVVQSVEAADGAPVTAAVLSHHVLRVSEVKRPDAPVTIEYTVSNGARTATGQVRVVSVPAATKLRPPEAKADEVTVHAGDVVTIPVLRNDSHPDGLELAVTPELVEEPGTGEAFVSEDTVRFKAGAAGTTEHLVYEVTDPNGQRDSAQATITVVDDPENAAPQPPDVDARVLAGATARVALPLEGSDPDGDHVSLEAVTVPPTQGTVDIVDGQLEYTASKTGAGPDEITYSVTDARGASSAGTVAVGIATPPEVNQPPLAVDDESAVRPGRTVGIDALANDSDPNGDQVGLLPESFEGAGDLDPVVTDDLVVVTAPEDEGIHTFYYGIEDSFAARATGAITVEVARDAPLLSPVARDDDVAPEDVTSSVVTVDVAGNDSDPDGLASELEVAVPGAEDDGTTVTDDGEIAVRLGAEPRVLTYEVTDPDGLTAQAFLRVPRDGTLPRLRDGLDPVEVIAGEPTDLDLTDYVVVADGRSPRITEESNVAATEGDHEVTGPTTLTYTADKAYSGPAAVTFEVTDGDGPDDPEGRTAVLSLPLKVVPGENQPPVISGTPAAEAAAGEETVLDLARFVTDPEDDPLTVEITGSTEGLSLATEGSRVRVTVAPDVPKGTTAAVGFTVADVGHPPVAGELAVTVVASNRPLARANTDEVVDAHQGEQTTVDVLTNDTNPFPSDPLELVDARLESGKGTVEMRGDAVAVTPPADFLGVLVVRYRVADVTGDPTREVEGTARVTVLGKPETPRAAQVEEVRSRTVVLTWDPPADNGASITGYTVRSSGGGTTDCPTTTCTVTGLTNNQTYTFTVQAENEVGTSAFSPPSEEARPDDKPDQPAPPELAFGDESLTVTWKNRTYTDRSPIECVNLEISPAPPSGAIQKTCLTGTRTTWEGLRNGVAYSVRVQARNAAPDPSDWSTPSAPETPAAPPARPAAPTTTRTNTAVGGQITVSWTAPANNGDPVSAYHLDVLKDGAVSRTIRVTATSQTVQELDVRASYRFRVTAQNKAGRSPVGAQSAAVVPYGVPSRPGTPTARLGSDTNGRALVSFGMMSQEKFRGPGGQYEIRADGWDRRGVTNGSPANFTGLSNGDDHTFEVRACNDYICSDWSERSNAVNPYTVPGAPPVDWFKDLGDDGHFKIWAASSNGGRRVDRIEYRLSGDATREGTRERLSDSWQAGSHSFQTNVPTGPGRSYTLHARLCNAAGCGAWTEESGRTGGEDSERTLTTYKGASAVGYTNDDGSTCTASSCAYLGLSLRNAAPNFDFGVYCVASGEKFSPTAGGNLAFETTHDGRKFRTDANGNFTGELPCAWGTTGVAVQVSTFNWGAAAAATW